MICGNGILLYPQKNFFYRIPVDARIEGGTWQDFTEIVSTRVQKTV